MNENAASRGGGALDPSRWIERHGSAMFAYARLRLPNAEAAEEAVQEALVAAWRSRDSFAGRSAERTWLIGILRYKILDAIRERSRGASATDPGVLAESLERGSTIRNPGGSEWGGEASGRSGGRSAGRKSENSSPDRDEVRRALEEALESIPEPARTALVLREIEGLAGKTVCEILGITETNLWTMIHRTKVRLRAELSARFGDEWGGSL